MKKTLAIVLVLCVCLAALTACGGGASSAAQTAASTAPTESTAAAGDAAAPAEGSIKVAMVLSGPINDGGWNESAYKGLMTAQETHGIETSYSESVQQPDFETVLRDYADKGYQVIICHGFQFSDAAMAVAPDFPDSMFCVVNGNSFQEPNVASFRFNTPQTGFLAGAAAAMLSESGTVAMLGGSRAPHIEDAVKGFEAGAQYINPDINVLSAYTENTSDVAAGKEAGMAFIEQGADVLCGNANQASLGVIDAAKTKGILDVGYIDDQYDVAPDTVMVSAIQSVQFLVANIIDQGVKGELAADLYLYGVAEEAIYLSDFHGHEDAFGAENVAKLEEIYQGLLDGSLKEQGILPASVFEEG